MAKQLPAPNERKKVFIVDDHPVFREGLASLIRHEPDLKVCGEANDAGRALSAIEKSQPDLVLVDIGLPDRSGLELIKDLHAVSRKLRVLAISMHDESLYAERVLRAGAGGYIMKQEGSDKILHALRVVLSGGLYVSRNMSGRLLNLLAGRVNPRRRSPVARLTDRELEVLQLVGKGHDSHAIARQLHLSFKTVHAHRSHIQAKLQLKNHTELISYAARWVESLDGARSMNRNSGTSSV